MSKKRLFLIAILIRLLLMPFTAHADIFTTYQRSFNVAFEKTNVFNYGDTIPHFVQAINLRFFSLFVGENYFANIQRPFYEMENINTLTFIFKLPYLIFEVFSWWLIFKYLIQPSKMNLILVLFNPIILYSVYVFGRYETLTIFSLLLLLLSLAKEKINWLLTLVLSVAVVLTRSSLVMILPGLFFIKTKLINKLLIFGLPVVFWLVKPFSQSGIQQVTQWVDEGVHTNYIMAAQFNLQFDTVIYISFVLMTIFILWLIKKLYFSKNTIKYSNPIIFSLVSIIILTIYYATSIFHPQYFCWIIPFFWLILDKYKDNKFLLFNFVLINIFYFLTPIRWGNPTTIGVLFPISGIFRQIPIKDVFTFFDYMKISNIGKSVFSGILLFNLIEILKQVSTNENN